MLARYQLKDLFNADEFALFYEALPSKSLHFRGKRCSGGKHSKVQLTGMAVSNAFGEKIPMFVTGKSASPRCFKQVCKVPADIDLKRKHGWMGYFLRNGCMRSIVSSKCKEEGLLWKSIISLLIQNFQDWKLSIYNFCHQIPLPVHSRWILG